MKKKMYGVGILFSLFLFTFSNLSIQSPESCRRIQGFESGLFHQVQKTLLSILEDPEKGESSLQYGLTLGDKRLRTQVAKILAGLGIKSNPESNLGIFHNWSEVFILLGEVFLNPGDVVLYQGDSDLLEPLEYYGAKLNRFNLSALNDDSRIKLVYISDSSTLTPEEKDELLKSAAEHNFIIIERSLDARTDASSLKSSDKSGRVIFAGDFNQIIPGISQLIPLVYLEAPAKIMGKIEIAKGALTLCTNSLLQGILIEMLSPKVDAEEIEFIEDISEISEEEFQNLLSVEAQNLKPSEIREILKYASIKGLIYLAGGVPDPTLFPREEIIQIVSEITPQEWSEILTSSSVQGLPRLRIAVAKRISQQIFKGEVQIPSQDILVTNGSQQALDLLGRWAEKEGRKIITETPTYLGVITAVAPHLGEENIFHLDLRTSEGLERLRTELQQLRDSGEQAPIIYLTPTFGNPGGYLWSEKERQALIEVVREFRESGYDVVIVEDDPYGELNYTGLEEGEEKIEVPAFKQLYPEGVIYLATNSKVFSPGTRIGYIIGNDEYTQKFLEIMESIDINVSALSQFISARFIESGMLDQHIEKLRVEYSKKARAMQEALMLYMPEGVKWDQPLGGLFVWVRVPQEWGLDLRYLLHNLAVKEGINIDGETIKFAYVPGNSFSVDGSTDNAVRLCFATASIEEIYKGIHAFAEMIRQQRP